MICSAMLSVAEIIVCSVEW